MDDLKQIDIAQLRGAATQAHHLGEDLVAAHFEEKNRPFFLGAAEDKLIDIGHVLGLTFSRTHRIRGELAIQRAERAIVHGTRDVVENMAAKALSADTWKRRAEESNAALTAANRQIEDLEAEVLALRAGNRRAAA